MYPEAQVGYHSAVCKHDDLNRKHVSHGNEEHLTSSQEEIYHGNDELLDPSTLGYRSRQTVRKPRTRRLNDLILDIARSIHESHDVSKKAPEMSR